MALAASFQEVLDSLPDDTYRYDGASHTLSGRRPGQSFRLGDRVRVAVARVDLDRRVLDLRLVGQSRRPKAGIRDRHAGRAAKGRPSGHGGTPKPVPSKRSRRR